MFCKFRFRRNEDKLFNDPGSGFGIGNVCILELTDAINYSERGFSVRVDDDNSHILVKNENFSLNLFYTACRFCNSDTSQSMRTGNVFTLKVSIAVIIISSSSVSTYVSFLFGRLLTMLLYTVLACLIPSPFLRNAEKCLVGLRKTC